MKTFNRRHFIKAAAVLGTAGMTMPRFGVAAPAAPSPLANASSGPSGGEILYNNIQLPRQWPPRNIDPASYAPIPVPYLITPPKVIRIDVGRQLFVDGFLVEQMDLQRVFHRAKKLDTNPILKPETRLERGGDYLPTSVPKDGGVWWDPRDRVFKMWYEAGWLENVAHATSYDGIHWDRPNLDIAPGTNRILPGFIPSSDTVVLDNFTSNPDERFKLLFRQEGGDAISRRKYPEHGYCMVSADGVHWSEPVATGYLGDRSTMFFNPFRKKWVYSLRTDKVFADRLNIRHGRARMYREHDDFLRGAKWNFEDLVYWAGADDLDHADPAIGDKPQLYNLSAVAYESLLLGIHEILLGPSNPRCMKLGVPKITDLKLGFSRDGFHWDRPDRTPFIASTRQPGSWDRGYVQPVGGLCTIVGEELRFYYTGFQGDEKKITDQTRFSGTYANGSTGIATLRRDGFASLHAGSPGGTATTRPVVFSGSRLFVNVDCPRGQLVVEVLDPDMSVLAAFSAAKCVPISVNRTLHEVKWNGDPDLSALRGKPVRFRFHLADGDLYAFWVSTDANGASRGFVAAGGPGYTSSIDDVGLGALKTT